MSPRVQEIFVEMVRVGIPVMGAVIGSSDTVAGKITKTMPPKMAAKVFYGFVGFLVGTIVQTTLFSLVEKMQIKGLPKQKAILRVAR